MKKFGNAGMSRTTAAVCDEIEEGRMMMCRKCESSVV